MKPAFQSEPRFLDPAQAVDPDAIASALAPWLDDLEARIDPVDEERLWNAWTTFADCRWPEPLFQLRRRQARPPGIDWPVIGVERAITNPRQMVLRQLKGCSDVLAAGSGSLLCVRSDYGTGILPSLFGVGVERMAPELDTLPGTRPLGRQAMARIAAEDAPGPDAGLWPLVRAVGVAFRRCLEGRPNLARHLHIYHPDLQGPMDVLEMAWGSECFVAFCEEPELVHAVLRRITDAYVAVMADWDAVVPDRHPGYCPHWGLLHRGHIMLRDDSAMNLSPAMFKRYIAPYDAELLRRCGGGAIHACGKVAHFLALATALPGVHAFNFGQPDLNDPRLIGAGTVARGVPIIGMWPAAVQRMVEAGVEPRGLIHVC